MLIVPILSILKNQFKSVNKKKERKKKLNHLLTETVKQTVTQSNKLSLAQSNKYLLSEKNVKQTLS